METLLKIKDLKIDYAVKDGLLSAVDKVNMEIQCGEIFALVGESGCGKTTVAYSIMQLLLDSNSITSGSIEFMGKDLFKATKDDMENIRGKLVGMIFQNPLDSLNPVYRTGTQVCEAIMLDHIPKHDAVKKTLELYKDLKIPDAERHIKSFPHELSGGMRQRIMIAMMLSRNPALLIADEPTTALDVTIEAQILSIMRELCDKYGTSILIITHNFGIVAEIADRVGVMYAGNLVEVGDVYSVFENPLHPYTEALMETIPRHSKHDGRIKAIEGTVPRIIGRYEGCRFANRCKYASKICFSYDNSLREIEKEHFSSCCRNFTEGQNNE